MKDKAILKIQLMSPHELPREYRPGAVLAGYDKHGRLAEVICTLGDAAAVCELLAAAAEGSAG